MEIKKEDYIKSIAKNLADNRKRIDKIKQRDTSVMTPNARSKYEADLNWEWMYHSMNEERLKFALGSLKLDDLREYYNPSSFQKYDGIRKEMANLKFI